MRSSTLFMIPVCVVALGLFAAPGLAQAPPAVAPPAPAAVQPAAAPPAAAQPAAAPPAARAGRLARTQSSGIAASTATSSTADLTREAEPAIERGLRWMEKEQRTDGGWGEKYTVAVTSLGLIANMARGYTPGTQPYGKVMDKGLDFLLKESKSSPSGYMGTIMYEHGLATLALSEIWGQTDRDDEVKTALKQAVDVILRSQNRAGGWRYNPRPIEADVSVTAMQTVALASARQAGILIPDRTIEMAIRYIKSCRDHATGGFTYQGGPPAGFARTSACCFALMMCGEAKSEEVQGGLDYIMGFWERAPQYIEWYWYGMYYSSLAMHRASDEQFARWYPQVRRAVMQKQVRDGHWDGDEGPQYATAMALIVLSIPFDFVPAYQK